MFFDPLWLCVWFNFWASSLKLFRYTSRIVLGQHYEIMKKLHRSINSTYRTSILLSLKILKWAFLIKICLLFVVVVGVVVLVVVNFSHFLLLRNQKAIFNKTWHKTSLGEVDSSLFKWRATPFSKENHNKTAEKPNSLEILNLLQNQLANFNQTWYKASFSWINEIQVYSNKRPRPFPRRDM